MREYKIIQVSKKVPAKQTCNMCGIEIEPTFMWQGGPYLHEIDLHPGYGSAFDMENIEFDLCDECLHNLILSFKIPVKGMD